MSDDRQQTLFFWQSFQIRSILAIYGFFLTAKVTTELQNILNFPGFDPQTQNKIINIVTVHTAAF